jgi:hypothetical protein
LPDGQFTFTQPPAPAPLVPAQVVPPGVGPILPPSPEPKTTPKPGNTGLI